MCLLGICGFKNDKGKPKSRIRPLSFLDGPKTQLFQRIAATGTIVFLLQFACIFEEKAKMRHHFSNLTFSPCVFAAFGTQYCMLDLPFSVS